MFNLSKGKHTKLVGGYHSTVTKAMNWSQGPEFKF
jgi:hypothetical protein